MPLVGGQVSEMCSSIQKLKISLFSGMRWSFAGHELTAANKKLCALVSYLALNGVTKQSRERLVGILWGETEELRARASLRQTVRQLRKIADEVGYTGFQIGRDFIELSPGSFVMDVDETCTKLEQSTVDHILLEKPNICDTILEGYEDLDSGYRVWLLATRQNILQRILRLSQSRIDDRTLTIQQRARFAEVVLNLDPTHEPACQFLMHQKTLMGDVAGAIKSYNTLWEFLDKEYDMEPSEQTIELVAKIKSGDALQTIEEVDVQETVYRVTTRDSSHYLPEAPQLPVINVENIEDAGISHTSYHQVRGFRHLLMGSLARFREWRVADNVSEMDPSQTTSSIVYTLQGSAYTSGADLNMILTMKEVKSNIVVWSDRFSYDMLNWAQIHYRVLSKIAMTLNVQVSAKKLSEILSNDSTLNKSYEQWLFGQSLIMSFDPGSWNSAEEIFKKLVEESPNFSPAYSSLVQLGNSWHIAQPGHFRSEERQRNTLEIAQRSIQIDPIDSRSHLALAWAYAFCGQYNQSYPHFDMAIELNEYDPWTVISAAQGYAFLGNSDKATQYSKYSRDMAFLPSPPYWGYHAGINFMSGNYEAALETGLRAKDSLVNNGIWRAASYLHLGDKPNARKEIDHCYNLVGKHWIGRDPPNKHSITNWLAQLFPIRNAQDNARLLAVLELAED